MTAIFLMIFCLALIVISVCLMAHFQSNERDSGYERTFVNEDVELTRRREEAKSRMRENGHSKLLLEGGEYQRALKVLVPRN